VAETGRVLLDVTASLPPRQPPSVVIAALPDGIGPLPLGAAVPPVKAEPPAAAEPPGGTAPAEPPKVDERLTLRAEELFRKGDVSGARLLLERALDSGNARAAFLLAETFDPNVLSRMGVFGIRGDAAKARELYGRARAMGMAQAGERMEALK
jgi:TPR repeat protein